MEIWLKQKTRLRMNYEWIGKTIWKIRSKKCEQILNIAGRLPENSRNRFVDRQSQKKL